MAVIDMPKTPKQVPEVKEDPDAVTTWKCYQKNAKVLRLIGAHLNMKQEAVLALFSEDFENFLATIEAQRDAERKKR
ncbi:MAG TPA: hypothetical protein VGE74_08635 [Gemmata sp.]